MAGELRLPGCGRSRRATFGEARVSRLGVCGGYSVVRPDLDWLRCGCTSVAAAILAAVEGGILPPGPEVRNGSAFSNHTPIPPGRMPGSTAGKMPATTLNTQGLCRYFWVERRGASARKRQITGAVQDAVALPKRRGQAAVRQHGLKGGTSNSA